MERKKVEKNLKDWAKSLGFRLPSGSTLPPDYFAALGATPHRRQLWEVIVEVVQPRKKIEQMRKEILAARLKGFLGKFNVKETGDRYDLWERQKKLEGDIREKRNEISKLEKAILTRSSDLILEMCKLAEIQKQCEEYKDKKLVLMLHTRRQKKIMAELEQIMKNCDSDLLGFCYQDFNSLKEDIQKLEEHINDSQDSKILNNQNESTIREENLWEEVIKWKKTFHEKFKCLLEEIKSNEKSFLRKELLQTKGNLHSSLAELKQKMTEKALEVMVNTKEGKVLNLRIEELMSKLEEIIQKDESINDSFSTAYPEREKYLEMLASHAKALALKSYQNFLQDELKKFKDDKYEKMPQDTREKFELTMKSMEEVSDEIDSLKLERQKLSNDIMTRYDELRLLLKAIGEENKKGTYKRTVEDTVASLKTAFVKQIAIFIQTPLDAFRKVETSSGRILFECESSAHCLNNYGGEWNDFFASMLIPPMRNVSTIIMEMEKRKKLIAETKEFISKWEKLIQYEKNIQDSLSSIKSESRICNKNFKDADGLLWTISLKSEKLQPDIEFLKKILKNWVEQPYRLMIKEAETVNGLNLRQYEEAYSREKQE